MRTDVLWLVLLSRPGGYRKRWASNFFLREAAIRGNKHFR
jgi:hypothetical protein